MKAFGMATCGSDMEVKFLPSGDPVGEISLAFRLGRKDKQSGEYATQWVKATLFGKRAEILAPMLLKGSKHAFHLRDIRVEEYTTQAGDKRSTMRADIEDVELGGKGQGAAPVPARADRNAPQGTHGNGFDDMDSDIPF